jgi:nitroreductase
MQQLSQTEAVDTAIRSRMSVRAFTQQTVARADIEAILEVASRAPSGTNCQPWRVYVLQGASRDALVDQVCAAHDAIRADPALAQGWGLYGLLGIGKGDKDKMHAQHQRNYRFFDAPVGLIFTIDRVMGRGSLVDYGAFMQSIMVAARGRGLHTCPQAAWNGFAKIIMPHIGAGEGEMLVCGMALGYADADEPVNGFVTPRVPVAEFTHWLD